MNPTPLPLTLAQIESGITSRQHLGCQLYVSIKGHTITDIALGERRPGIPLRNTDLMLWLSATKPLAAIAIAQLWERALLTLDDPVALHIPEFAARGKDAVTLRHLLTHTAGFRGVANTWSTGPWDALISRICNAPLEPGWTPGQKAGYHVASSWFILGELVRRLTGEPFEHYVRIHILIPLNATDSWVGMPEGQLRRYQSEDRIAPIYNTSTGDFDASYPGNTDDNITSCRPAGNGRGPARELARIYESLLAAIAPPNARAATPSPGTPGEGRGEGLTGNWQLTTGNSPTLLRPQTIEALTSRHRVNMLDQTFRHLIDWGLGVIVNSAHYHQPTLPYGFGPHASPRAFGHSGSQSSIAFADPEHHLAAAVIFNGMPGDAPHNSRITATLAALYEDLHLATPS